MTERYFNLLSEKWIRVLTPECETKEVSLMEAFRDAHLYTDLGGELPTQDVAVLRLMLAILHTVFSRVNTEGEDAPLETADDAIGRWRELRDMGRFPIEPVETYLEKYRDRFWLFDDDLPFYQVPLYIGTEYTGSKLNGQISESSNKLKLFPMRTGEERTSVSFAEAARWLLYINAYDDTSSKKMSTDEFGNKLKGKNEAQSIGTGWIGKLGMIEAVGDDLFETLMLNLTMLRDGEELFGEDKPTWECELRRKERVLIPAPDNIAELYTLQSRRIHLARENDRVTGYSLYGGDYFERKDSFIEQMTVWRKYDAKGKEPAYFQPSRHDPSRQLWREFSSIAALDANDEHRPGVVSWITYLKMKKIIARKDLVRFRIASVKYGDKDFFVTDVFSDSLSFSTDLLTELGVVWVRSITDEIDTIEKVARIVSNLATDLDKAEGGDGNAVRPPARELFYSTVDAPFRVWLGGLEPTAGNEAREAKLFEWRSILKKLSKDLAGEMIDKAGDRAIIGRKITQMNNNVETTFHYSAPEAYGRFMRDLSKTL